MFKRLWKGISRFTAPCRRPPVFKSNSKFESDLQKYLVKNKKANQILLATIVSTIVSSRKQPHVQSHDNFQFRINVEVSDHAL